MVELNAEKVVVTAALPYANGEIHCGGFASTYLPADVFARFCRHKGQDLVYVCATDDFGTAILVESEREGKTPEEYVAHWNRRDKEDLEALGVHYDLFYRTSSKENVEFTQYFFTQLFARGYIYKQRVWQPYCENDGKFLPDRYVKGDCPFCGAKDQYSDGCERCGRTFQPGEVLNPHCAICGGTPVQRESDHYFFQLSKFATRLSDWLKGNGQLQGEVRNYVLRWIEDGLQDWDITRDIAWGVPIPRDDVRACLYLWFDNHLCYISTALKVLSARGVDGQSFWNSAKIYHYIGKDRVYHHYLFLPAMRLGVGEGPERSRLVRGEEVRLKDGRVVKPGDVLGPPRPGLKIVYTGDTRYSRRLTEFSGGADILIHDSTFDQSLGADAAETYHSTCVDAARAASDAGAKRLFLFHISARYRDPSLLSAQARKYFPNVEVAEDYASYDLP